jgi:hypothetical protein
MVARGSAHGGFLRGGDDRRGITLATLQLTVGIGEVPADGGCE